VLKKIYSQSGGIPRRVNLIAQPILHKFAEQLSDYTLPVNIERAINYKWIWGGISIVVLFVMSLISYWQFSNPTATELLASREVALPLPLQPEPTQLLSQESDKIMAVETSTIVSDQTQPIEIATVMTDVNPKQLLANDTVKDETWLLQQDDSAYTLQVLGAYDHITLKNFLAKQTASEQFALFKTDYHNKDWYVLVYGIYANRAAALVALKQLPTALQQTTQPWARSLADIKTHIRKRLPISE